MDLDLDLESLVIDLDLYDLRHHLAQGSSGDEDEDLNLESPLPTVSRIEVEETVVDLPPEQVRRLVDLRDYRLSADIVIENPNNTLTLYHVQKSYL